MAVLGSSFLDIIEVQKRTNPDGGIAPVVETLHKLNPVMKDANVITCNNGTSHRTTIRTGLPAAQFGELYKGTPYSKSGTAQVDDVTGFIEQLSGVDTRLLALAKDAAAVRMSEAAPAMEAISQQVEQSFFYSNVHVNGRQFHGLAPRFNMVPTNAAAGAAATQVIDGGGTGADNTSIWMVGWGDSGVSLLTPEGIPGGIIREDMDVQRVTDDDNNPYYIKEEKFTQHVGATVKDYRYVTRIANIDINDVIAGSVDLYALLRKGYYKNQARRNDGLSNGGMSSPVRMAIYCNADILEALDALSTNGGSSDSFVRLTPREIQGEEVLTWRGKPIRETDALLNTEARVV